MVCSLGSGKMAVMARLLDEGSLLQPPAEEKIQQRVSIQLASREFRGADEANLLDEEDMNVFGLKPMTDALDLVCCNACKKPVKASQYTVHAELCRTIISAVVDTQVSASSIGHKKPPRKERKKLTSYSNHVTPIIKQERSEAVDANNATASRSQLGSSTCIGITPTTNAKMVDLKKSNQSVPGKPPPTKRIKLIYSQQPLQRDPVKASGLMKLTSTKDSSTHVPAPLATKIYYSQRNNRLRSAIANMYHAASRDGLCNSAANVEASPKSIMPLRTSCQISTLQALADELFDKRESSGQTPYMFPSKSLDACMDKSMENPSATNLSGQYPVDNALRPQTATQGVRSSNYLSMPYSLTGNSGQQPLQPNESLPVT